MENLIKRYFWAINLVVLATIAYLSARVANNLLAGVIAALPTHPKTEAETDKASAREPAAANTMEWANTITERNLFNSEPVSPDSGDAGTAEPQLPDHVPDEKDPNCRRSDGPLGLLATMVADPRDWSMAIVNDGSPDSRIVKEGQALGDYTVSAIYRERLVVARAGQYECVDLGSQGQKGTTTGMGTSSSTFSTPTPPPETTSTKDDNSKGITKTGEYSYTIDRDMLNEKLNDLESLARQARVIPHYRDGKPQGFKLVGVRPGSLYSHLGIRSGDVLKAVNGDEITSPNKALEMYEKLKNAGAVTLDVERRGRPIPLEFKIQ